MENGNTAKILFMHKVIRTKVAFREWSKITTSISFFKDQRNQGFSNAELTSWHSMVRIMFGCFRVWEIRNISIRSTVHLITSRYFVFYPCWPFRVPLCARTPWPFFFHAVVLIHWLTTYGWNCKERKPLEKDNFNHEKAKLTFSWSKFSALASSTSWFCPSICRAFRGQSDERTGIQHHKIQVLMKIETDLQS